MEQKIKSIEKGTGEGSTYFAVNDRYEYAVLKDKIASILECKKPVKWCEGLDTSHILTYTGFNADGKILFEIEANSSLTIIYE